MDKVVSELYNIKAIIDKDCRYNIPRYQRLYVWEDEQVKTLFNDIFTASQSKKDMYYIGGIITVKHNTLLNCFDLVDGQQRFTTLWLLANELGSGIQHFTRCSEGLRLNFSIRPNVDSYFNHLLIKKDEQENDTEFDDLIRISKARKTIQSLITENLNTTESKDSFIDFLSERVKMVVTEVPKDTDLNKLFETLNNRGVQLAQHEILKARLLAKIDNRPKRYRYGALWNACCDMNNYVERSLTYETGNARAIASTYTDWSGVHDWSQIQDVLKSRNSKAEKLNLKDIIEKDTIWEKEDQFNKDERDFNEIHHEATDEEIEPVRSILTFPLLLLHTLRIFLYQKTKSDIQRINEKELLTVFDNHLFIDEFDDIKIKNREEEKESIAFMNLLFKVREVFDKYIIKWVEQSQNDEVHLIKEVKKKNQKKGGQSWYLRRLKTQKFDGLAFLQSILYHSQQNTTQYWLTPFIYRLLKFPSFDEAFVTLKKLDNLLFSTMQEHRGLPERTWECMDDYPELTTDTSVLLEDSGTGFPHYWFYKLEFVLWHEREKFEKQEEWKHYKITARNSIEHISPQNPREAKDKLCIDELDHFGNLVLVTRSINSEYSDLAYIEKKAKFLNKKSKGSIDSLKSDLVYKNDNWNDQLAKNHEEQMIDLLKSYFEKTMI
jgi:hypothetical protein